ncbi:DUF58 domain-containing protein [Thiomonas sp.]
MSSSADSLLPPPAAKPARRGGWAQRFDRWALARHPAGGSTRLTHRNVYILPTRTGWFFALLLLVLLVLSINYQLNLGYLLTFLLAGSAMMAMHVTHHNLRGLQLTARMPEGLLHQGRSARLGLLLQGGARDRWGLALRPAGSPPLPPSAPQKKARRKAPNPPYPWTYTDCARDSETPLALGWTPPRRGLLPWPVLTVESRYPLGVWIAWSRWQPQGELLVLPAVEHPAPPLPPARPMPGNGPALARGGGETEGVRAWRSGDSMRQVLWKKFARSDELVSRDTAQPQARAELWLDFAALPTSLDTESRLSRLCAWVLAADREGVPYGLQLGTRQIPPATGAAHRAACLRLLALHPGPLLQPRSSIRATAQART